MNSWLLRDSTARHNFPSFLILIMAIKTLFGATSLLFASSISALVAISPANAATIVPPGSEVAGKSIGEWTTEWWNWALGQSTPNAFNEIGENANVNQSGPVFFIAGNVGPTGGEATRSFTVPSNKYLLFPLSNAIFPADAELEAMFSDDIVALVADAVNQTDNLFFSIDGVSLSNPFEFRETSPEFFDIEVVEGNPFNISTEATRAFADGYYVMLAPLPSGDKSTVIFGGGTSTLGFSTKVTATISSVPEPGNALTFIGAGMGLAAWISISRLQRKVSLG